LIRDYEVGVPVIWQVTAPDSVIPPRNISVERLNAPAPTDENTNDTAAGEDIQTKSITIETGDFGRLAIDSLRIETQGARNGIVSSEQQFRIRSYLGWENAQSVNIRLILPSEGGYTGGNSFNGSLNVSNIDGGNPTGQTDVAWDIIAPSFSSDPALLIFEISGNDFSDPDSSIQSARDTLSFETVLKADLRLRADITAPESAVDSVLTEGQEFTITARYEKTGEADVTGRDTLEIILPTNYRLFAGEPEKRAILPSGQVNWRIVAPAIAHENPRAIIVRNSFQGILDVNTRQNPPLEPREITISVTTRPITLIARLLGDNLFQYPTTVPRGATNQPILALEFENPGDEAIEVLQFNFTVKDNTGQEIAPNALLRAMSAVEYPDESNVLGVINSMPATNPVTFNFTNEITVPANNGDMGVLFRVDLLSQTDVEGFQIQLESPSRRDIIARVVNADTVDITDEDGAELRNALT